MRAGSDSAGVQLGLTDTPVSSQSLTLGLGGRNPPLVMVRVCLTGDLRDSCRVCHSFNIVGPLFWRVLSVWVLNTPTKRWTGLAATRGSIPLPSASFPTRDFA